MRQYLVVINNKGYNMSANTPLDATKKVLNQLGTKAEITPYKNNTQGIIVEVSLLGGTRESKTYYVLSKIVKFTDNFAEVRCTFDDKDYWYIDAWTTDNDNEEGEVVAKVSKKTKKVIYNNNLAKTDKKVQEIIKKICNNQVKPMKADIKGKGYAVQGSVVKTVKGRVYRQCGIEACPYNTNEGCVSKKCIQ